MGEATGESGKRAPWDAWLDDAPRSHPDQLVAREFEPPRAGRTAPLPSELHPVVAQALPQAGVESLYTHQAHAFDAAMHGDTIVTTGTASGKSLCFNLPVLHTLACDARARALYLYPTKALAQDQARALNRLAAPMRRGGGALLRQAVYDGDTPRAERKAIRTNANVVLSNPDMLNQGILPNHERWAEFFANLAWVVVDEAHVYRGVFGSHVANVLRRLRRVAAAYGTEPRVLATSATIANPLELAGELCGTSFELISEDGAPAAGRDVVIWNTPLIDPALGVRGSALAEAASLLVELVRGGTRTICFMKSRRGVELIRRFAADALADRPDLADAILPYRGGYTAAQRRDIEQRLASGELKGVVATSALELGIDIGHLDAAICTTFPGTVASLRQMWGRAGRSSRGLAVYIAGDDALDQFFCRHPDEFMARPVEAAILDPANEQIRAAHLCAAAHELPLREDDTEFFGEQVIEQARALESAGRLRRRSGGFVPRGVDFPAASISLRSASADTFAIVDAVSGEVIGAVEAERAFTNVHPGAAYLHLGQAYEIDELDLAGRTVLARPFDGSWYTRPKIDIDVHIEQLVQQRRHGDLVLNFGYVSVTELVTAFQRVSTADHEAIALEPLDLPEQVFLTQALWYDLGEHDVTRELPLDVLPGALHAAEHAQIAVLPLIAMCDRWDIGGLSTAYHRQVDGPAVFIYDGHPGGIGITRRGFEQAQRLAGDALRLVGECACESGCPSCIQSPKCGNLNDPLHKRGAVTLLSAFSAVHVPASPAT
jgi:DEAD/DEAH box helicase domain-containing protein